MVYTVNRINIPEAEPLKMRTNPSETALVRPVRQRVRDELGRERTLDVQLPVCVRQGSASVPPLVLGMGPDPQGLADQLAANYPMTEARVVECPDFERQMPETWRSGISPHWKREDPFTLVPENEIGDIWCWLPGLRLFSEFWGPLVARLRLARLRSGRRFPFPSRPTLLLPGDERTLLTEELEQAFRSEGFAVVRLPAEEPEAGRAIADFLAQDRPALFLSVNLRGLDSEGTSFRLLQAAEVPAAIWFVDNPWHVLSSLRLPWWRHAHLFVSDASFVPALREHGARHVAPLPLASWFTPRSRPLFPDREIPPPDTPLVFAGRSAFPDKARFFAGCRLPEAVFERLAHATAPRPDFDRWAKALELQQLWPGHAVRLAGLGAEECSRLRRITWLSRAAETGLTVYGDAPWATLLPSNTTVRPPTDYYTRLPGIYAAAPYSLNITSLLLPAGLTQRHFDVWSAGGFLLSDATPGLELFPAELVRPIALHSPEEIADRVALFERDPAFKRDLAAAWVACLAAGHTYRHRVQTLCEVLEG